MAGDPTSEQTGFSGPQAAEIVGVSYRQLGLLGHPKRRQARAQPSGRLRQPPPLQPWRPLRVGCRQTHPARDGPALSLARIRAVIERLRSEPAATAMTAVLVITATDVLFTRSETELVDAVQGGPAALNVVTLSAIRSDLEAAIEWLVPDAAHPAAAA